MGESWPPDGYGDPKEYDRNEYHVVAVGSLLAIVFVGLLTQPMASAAREWVAISLSLFQDSATVLGYLPLILFAVIGATVPMIALWKVIIVPIHEGLHYLPGLMFDNNPDFGYADGLVGKNPRVVPLTTNITIRENLISITAPFAVIGVVTLSMMLVTSGLLRGIFAFALIANSVASAQDIYHVLRLSRMPAGTRFANFEESGGITTEYAEPIGASHSAS